MALIRLPDYAATHPHLIPVTCKKKFKKKVLERALSAFGTIPISNMHTP